MKSHFNQFTLIIFVALAAMITACNGSADENEMAIAVALTQTAVSSAQPTAELPATPMLSDTEATVPPPPAIETTQATDAADPIAPATEPAAEPTAEVIENIDVTDWYAPVGTFPFP